MHGTASYRRLEDEFYRVINKFSNKQWLEFARFSLKLPEHLIDDIRSDYSNDAREQKYQMMSLWHRKNGRSATVEVLRNLVERFFRSTLEQRSDSYGPQARPSNDTRYVNPQSDRTDVVQTGQQPSSDDNPSLLPGPSVDIHPSGRQDRVFSTSNNPQSFSQSPSDYPSLVSHRAHSESYQPRATVSVTASSRNSNNQQLPSSSHDAAFRSDATRPKRTGSQIVNEPKPTINLSAAEFQRAFYPFPIENNNNVMISVKGKHAIGVQSNFFMNNARASKNKRNEVPPEEMARYCDNATNASIIPSDPSIYYDHLEQSHSFYKITHKPKGSILILNNTFAGKRDERFGSQLDRDNMARLWIDLGCKVISKDNLSAEKVLEILKRFAASPQAYQSDFVAVVIMSHGGQENGEDVVYGDDMKPVLVADILDAFNNDSARRLQGIPKLFFLQCCRGSTVDKGVTMTQGCDSPPGDVGVVESSLKALSITVSRSSGTNDTSDAQGIVNSRMPTMSDCMISFATQRGNRAFRNVENGSWFINAIVNIFARHACDQHILELMTMVNNAVSGKKASNTNDPTVHEGMEMSDFKSTLRKKLFFFPGFPVEEEDDLF